MNIQLTTAYPQVDGISIVGTFEKTYSQILNKEALSFLFALQRRFNPTRKELLNNRVLRQKEIDKGTLPDFLTTTQHIRNSNWQVAPLPADLLDRRVEITGPVDRKMIINALNSGAKVFMADFEDSNAPSWKNNLEGQINLRDAVNGNITFEHPRNGKLYQLNDKIATLMVRPRGWHLEEKNLLIDGEFISASLFDFGLFIFHNAKNLLQKNSGPYFYLPKIESHLEARLWNDVFVFAQDYLEIPQKSIKATVLIETILASFELDEILFELRDHSAGLNCGRWDYIFSFIKKFKNLNGFVLPDRGQIGMKVPFMSAYAQLVIKTCHKRGVHAMGGMAAQIPIKNDAEANAKAIEKVRLDKMLEVKNGHDGTWVAHPDLVKLAMDIFDEHMPHANQIANKRTDLEITAQDLIALPNGTITETGIRQNINVAILYIESWLRGVGAAAIYHLMEDAATAEISRTQIWQWLQNKVQLADGNRFDIKMYNKLKEEEIDKIKKLVGNERYFKGKFDLAIELFDQLVLSDEYQEFLTLEAYNYI